MKEKFKIQESQYSFPYHHLVNFDDFSNYLATVSGIEYYGYMKKILKLIKSRNFESLLDVGCGDGKMIFELAKFLPDKKFTGVDLSERAILFARAFNYENKAEFYCGDVSVVSGGFDIITMIEVLEHVPENEIKTLVSDVYEKLNENGLLVVSVPSDNFPVQSKHYRHYNLELLKKQLEGFVLMETYYAIRGGRPLHWAVKLSYKFCAFQFARKMILAFSEKFLFIAEERTARHIICVFGKKI